MHRCFDLRIQTNEVSKTNRHLIKNFTLDTEKLKDKYPIVFTLEQVSQMFRGIWDAPTVHVYPPQDGQKKKTSLTK